MKRVDFLFFDAGGGHRSAATALKSVIEQQQRGWQVRLVDLQDVLAPLDIFRKLTGIQMEDVYNNLLAKGWTLGSKFLVPPMHWLIRMYHPGQVRMLTEFWKKDTPDMVVSVIPNFNRALFQALHQVDPAIPLVTILTDMADYPPNFWMEKQDQYIICGTKKALEQALQYEYKPEKTFLVSGMILRPSFYEQVDLDRCAERQRLGLAPDKPTGLVLFGGQGSGAMLRIAERVRDTGAQFIFICGKNEKLAARLRGLPGPFHVVGFTHEVPYYMQISDFMIGKPGPGSISEALSKHLPVIIECNAWTLPQEVYNTVWVREKQVGIVLPNFLGVERAVREMVAKLDEYRNHTFTIENRAVFEILDILQSILDRSE